MVHIRDILHRRTDLSTFVVHLTRDRAGSSAIDSLVAIASSMRLEAHTPFGWAKYHVVSGSAAEESQRVVCFTETPLEHLNLVFQPIEPSRQVELCPYGVALTKVVARRLGINPVWYVDQTWGETWWIATALDDLRGEALVSRAFEEHPAARILPFVEAMRTLPNSPPKEFWWEREWRHVGRLDLPADGVLWLCPEDRRDELNARVGRTIEPWIDPRWGLEQIVAHLAGFEPHDVSPFLQPPPWPVPAPPPF